MLSKYYSIPLSSDFGDACVGTYNARLLDDVVTRTNAMITPTCLYARRSYGNVILIREIGRRLLCQWIHGTPKTYTYQLRRCATDVRIDILGHSLKITSVVINATRWNKSTYTHLRYDDNTTEHWFVQKKSYFLLFYNFFKIVSIMY